MGEHTDIEWADHSFNPWIGCSKVSAGCANCYAEREFDHRRHFAEWGPGKPRRRTVAETWRQPLRWDKQAAADGVRRRVFCASLADVFDPEVPIEWLADLFDLVDRCRHLDWLLLTKRPHLIRSRVAAVLDSQTQDGDCPGFNLVSRWICGSPPPNVWLGTSVEDQAAADERIPQLVQIPAAKRFLSCEPLLGSVDLDLYDLGHRDADGRLIDWIIAGGESGPQARPMHPDWARSLRDQCQDAGVPFFFKQWGEWAPGEEVEANGTDWVTMYEDQSDGGAATHHWPDADIRKAAEQRGRTIQPSTVLVGDTEVLRVGKKRAGRLLDGRTWSEIPTP